MRPPRPAYILSGLAILTFATFLGFALLRLFLVEQDMRDNVDENMLWVITQAQVASHRLDGEVNRHLLGDPDADPALRFDVLASRLILLDDGPQRRYLEELGLTDLLDATLGNLQGIERLLNDLEPRTAGAGAAIHARLAPLMMALNRIATAVMVQEWETTGARLDDYRHSMLRIIGSILGILLSGLVLVALLLHALRQRQEAQQALAAHRDQLKEEVARHIYRYKEAAEALSLSLERERGVSDFHRSFAAMVSHQFRTPLAVIDSGLQRLERRQQQFTAEQRSERYRRLREAVAQMTRLIESSLIAARLDGKQVEASFSEHSLNQIVTHLCRLQQEATGITRLQLQHVPPQVQAWCDRALTEQILTNLISNALKYTPDHQPVTIMIAREGSHAVCRVHDNGPGIPPAEQAKLFTRFFRGRDAAGTTGIGLGLNIAHHLAHIQHGELTLHSSPEQGTTFTLWLPAAQEARDAQP